MAKYKVNLDKVWNLPVGVIYYQKDGKYCSLGLIHAAILGEKSLEPGGATILNGELYLDLSNLGFDAFWAGKNNDSPIMCGANPEDVRERCVRQILNKGVETGLFELEGLKAPNLVKELEHGKV